MLVLFDGLTVTDPEEPDMSTINVTIAQAIEAFGTNDLADQTEQQLFDQATEAFDEYTNRAANNLDTDDQEWRLARLAAALERLI